MAVLIDVQAFRDSIPPTVYEAAVRLQRFGEVGELEAVGGGVQAVVRGSGDAYQPWVGVVDRTLTAECECTGGEAWCAHAIAVALTAFAHDVHWSGAATPPSAESPSAESTEYLTAVQRLTPRQLTALVVDQAAIDRLFATRLLRAAGMLAEPDRNAVDRFDQVLREVATVTSSSRWEIHDIETAGHRLVAEVAILCAYLPSYDALELVEQALLVWDELAGYLIDAYHVRRTDPEQITEPLVQAHGGLCEQLGIEPVDLVKRLTDLVNRCGYDTVDPDAYAHLLEDHADAIIRRSDRW